MSSAEITLVNGKESSSVEVEDRGFMFGDGVFETMRFHRSHIPLWSYHLTRLLKGGQRLMMGIDQKRIEDELQQLILLARQKNMTCGRLKLIVTRGQGGRGVVPNRVLSAQQEFSQQQRPLEVCTVVWMLHSIVAPVLSSEPLSLSIAEHRLPCNKALAGIKHLNRLDYIVAATQVRSQEVLSKEVPPNASLSHRHSVLMLNTQNHVVETLHHNIFFVKGNTILTPTLSNEGVTGVMLTHLQEVVFNDMALSCETAEIDVNDLSTFEQAFISNAFVGVLPVESIHDQVYHSHTLAVALQHRLAVDEFG